MTGFVAEHRNAYGVEPICRVLEIAPSTYYSHAVRQADPEARPDRWRRDQVLEVEVRRVSVRQLAARLSEFGIKPKTTRLPNGDRLKGYVIEDFADAFHRYLSAAGGISSVTPRQPHSSAVCEASATVTHDAASRIAEAPEPAWDKACNGVTDKNGGSEKKEEGGTEREAFDL